MKVNAYAANAAMRIGMIVAGSATTKLLMNACPMGVGGAGSAPRCSSRSVHWVNSNGLANTVHQPRGQLASPRCGTR